MAGLCCPKCQFEQAPGSVCVACGIVFAKWGELARRSATPHRMRTITPMPEARAPSPDATRSNPRLTGLLVLFLALSGAVLLERMHEVRKESAEEAVDKELRQAGQFFQPPRNQARPLPNPPLDDQEERPRLIPPNARRTTGAPVGVPGRRPGTGTAAVCDLFTRPADPDDAGSTAGAPPESPGWRLDAGGWQEGLREQERTGAPLLALVVEEGCELCRALRRDVLDRPSVEEFLRRFIKVRIMRGAAPQASALAISLAQVSSGGEVPKLLLVAAPGRVPLPIPVVDQSPSKSRPVQTDALIANLTRRLKREASQLVLLAYELQREDDAMQAERVLDAALRIDARNAEAWFWRGSVRLALDRLGPAISDLRVAGALDPTHPNPWAELGGVAVDRGCHQEGVVYASRLLDAASTRESKARARGLRARALDGMGWRHEARNEAAQACDMGHRPSCQRAAEAATP